MTALLDVDLARWQHRFESHMGLIPKLLGAQLTLAQPSTGVSRGGSRFDRPQVTGGGFYDAIPIADEGAAVDATYLWSLLFDYTTAVGEWLDATTNIPEACPNTPRAAHDAALVIVGSLIEHAHLIHVHRELDDFEIEMFYEIRRMQRRYLPKHVDKHEDAEDCTESCGAYGTVRSTYDDAHGTRKPVLTKKCTRCGQTYPEENS